MRFCGNWQLILAGLRISPLVDRTERLVGSCLKIRAADAVNAGQEMQASPGIDCHYELAVS